MAKTTASQVESRIDHLERLLKKYPDVNAEVIVKEDAAHEGFNITRAVLDYGGGQVLDTQHQFSWHFATAGELEARFQDSQAMLKIPTYIQLEGGPFKLRPTIMTPNLNLDSPYLIDIVDGRPHVVDAISGQAIAQLYDYWKKRPLEYFQKKLPDGTAYTLIMEESGAASVLRLCQHWGRDEECMFCDINETTRTKRALGQPVSLAPKDPEAVAEVAFHLFEIEDWARWPDAPIKPGNIHITGGTVVDRLHGKPEHEFYLPYVDAIRRWMGNRVTVNLQTAPWTKELEKVAREHGVTTRMPNFEVWDARLFNIICPGKARFLGRDEWLKRTLDQVDVFGVGNVIPGFVAGVEMAQPWGFKTVEEAVKSTTEGMDFFMSHGIVVRPITWCIEGRSALAGQQPPPVDYFIQLDRSWYDLFNKYDLPPQWHIPIGPGRNRYMHSAAWDMGD